MVARPGDPGNGVPLESSPSARRVDIAYGGSCTAGKREDFDHYHEVLALGRRARPARGRGVTLYLQFGTAAVRDYCIERGYLPTFERVGAEILQPSCGACANCGPGASTAASRSPSARSTAISPAAPVPARSGSRARRPWPPAPSPASWSRSKNS